MGSRPEPRTPPEPLGWLPGGEAYYAPIGEMRYDGDQVQCHLCGRWLKIVGAIHIRVAHEITLDEYRELFHLRRNVSTAAPDTSKRKRASMLEQIASGERVQPYEQPPGKRTPPAPPTVRRFRSLAVLRPDLVVQLHPTRNGDLDPATVGVHSKRRLWWHCTDCGGDWEMPVKLRTRKQAHGCPACGKQRRIAATIARNRQPIAPERSLAALYPQLLAEWHPTRNRDLDPHTIAPGTEKKIWWQCTTCRHVWLAAGHDRTRTTRTPHGCPACARARHIARQRGLAVASREHSFGARYPHLVPEWHPTRNGEYTPYNVKPASEREIWWRCATCGHEWQATPGARSHSPRGGCRNCASSRAQRERWTKSRA
jgi:ssDNA-binding Zn-finger/Zn-ribbon topoisomerase 1